MTRAAVGPVSPAVERTSLTTTKPAYQAYEILHVGFAALPIVAGLDKFLHFLQIGSWEGYLAPVASRTLQSMHIADHTFMLIGGAIEVIAGLLVAVWPRAGAYVVMLWLLGIVVNLLLCGQYFDIALRDFGLALGALALARISENFGRPVH